MRNNSTDKSPIVDDIEYELAVRIAMRYVALDMSDIIEIINIVREYDSEK